MKAPPLQKMQSADPPGMTVGKFYEVANISEGLAIVTPLVTDSFKINTALFFNDDLVTLENKDLVMYCGIQLVSNAAKTLRRFYAVFLFGDQKIAFDTALTKQTNWNGATAWMFDFTFHLKEVKTE